MSKNPNLKAPYDSSPLCRVTLWLSLALLVLPSLQHSKAPTSSSSNDSPCPTPATLQAWAQVKASDFWSCSSWSEEGDFEPCLLVILPPFLSTLRLNPVYLLHRKLALSLSLLRAWLSGLYSTYCLTWQRPITMCNRSSQGRSCGLNGHGAISSQSYMGLLSFPSVSLWDANWMISPTWCVCLLMAPVILFCEFLTQNCSLSWISCISLFFHSPMFGGSWLSSSRDDTHG